MPADCLDSGHRSRCSCYEPQAAMRSISPQRRCELQACTLPDSPASWSGWLINFSKEKRGSTNVSKMCARSVSAELHVILPATRNKRRVELDDRREIAGHR